jgi:hypothetical protein
MPPAAGEAAAEKWLRVSLVHASSGPCELKEDVLILPGASRADIVPTRLAEDLPSFASELATDALLSSCKAGSERVPLRLSSEDETGVPFPSVDELDALSDCRVRIGLRAIAARRESVGRSMLLELLNSSNCPFIMYAKDPWCEAMGMPRVTVPDFDGVSVAGGAAGRGGTA